MSKVEERITEREKKMEDEFAKVLAEQLEQRDGEYRSQLLEEIGKKEADFDAKLATRERAVRKKLESEYENQLKQETMNLKEDMLKEREEQTANLKEKYEDEKAQIEMEWMKKFEKKEKQQDEEHQTALEVSIHLFSLWDLFCFCEDGEDDARIEECTRAAKDTRGRIGSTAERIRVHAEDTERESRDRAEQHCKDVPIGDSWPEGADQGKRYDLGTRFLRFLSRTTMMTPFWAMRSLVQLYFRVLGNGLRVWPCKVLPSSVIVHVSGRLVRIPRDDYTIEVPLPATRF